MMRVAVAALVIGMMAGTGLATAATEKPRNAMAICGEKYRAAQAAGTLSAGETWRHFLAGCRAELPKAMPAASSAPGSSDAQVAARGRMKQCSAQWKADKAAGKTGDQRWPAYWSACSARLKASG